MQEILMNKYLTPITLELLNTLPKEVYDDLLDAVTTIPFIKNLISPSREYAKDRPRDSKGRIIVDLSNPHILENMDYFRPSALHFEKYGVYTKLKPNSNPNSEFGKWIREEKRRIWEGYIRPSDGEWVTGYMYWYLNYGKIMLSKVIEGTKTANRVEDFPEMWEGIYWRYHYLYLARTEGHHAAELARRGASKSYSLASMMSHNLILGENEIAHKRTTTILTAYTKEYLSDKDGTLSKFTPMIDFVAENTLFPKRRLKDSKLDMNWIMGFKDTITGTAKGSLNSVLGVSSKDDESKLRGKRGYILIEEFGTFAKLLPTYNVILEGVLEGDIVFGLIYLVGTSGDDESDFAGALELMYNPIGYNIKALDNVYDKPNQGKKLFVFFFPGYVNRKGCYNKDGVSDVIKALIEILINRYKVKYNSSDPSTIIRRVAEIPITPAEAILKGGFNFFPVLDATSRINLLDDNPTEFDDVYTGELIIGKNGEVEYKPSSKEPIRTFKNLDNKMIGGIELFLLPERDKSGKVFSNRYIAGNDPYDNDLAESRSLGSTFILDLWTDKVVAEYTGRPLFADDFYEVTRRLLLFYNARMNYEAHPYNQIVRMPDGTTKLWKDVKIGDKLFSPNGSTVEIIDIPMEGEDDIYNIIFEDGREVKASSNHIWSVYTLNNRKNTKEITTKEMFDSGVINKFNQKKYYVPKHNMIDYPHKDVDIDPYTLGLLIAEGSLTKFIPEEYLINDYNTRLELLKGLMDGDGHANPKGGSIYVTVSKLLAEDIMLLIRSLGIYCKLEKSENSFRIRIASTISIFKLPRKIENQYKYSLNKKGSKAKSFLNKVGIKNIEYIGVDKCKCVTVDSVDGLYLIGDYITTHNCNKKGLFAYFSRMNSLYLLTDTLEFLRDKDMIKAKLFGNNTKGTTATHGINAYALTLLRNWLLSPVPVIIKNEDGEEIESSIARIYTLRNRALLEEIAGYNEFGNFDRISAMMMLMLLREDRMILYNGNLDNSKNLTDSNYLGEDPFFKNNYKPLNNKTSMYL